METKNFTPEKDVITIHQHPLDEIAEALTKEAQGFAKEEKTDTVTPKTVN